MNITTNLIGLFLIVFLIGPLEMMAQHSVSGTVVDSVNEEPIPGVNIMIEGTTTGTSTDSNGNYDLVAPSPQDTLVFSYIGFQTQQVPINDRSTINISLNPQAYQVDDVVVIGYGTQRMEDVTSAVSSISSDEFIQSSPRDAASLIQAKIPGLAITTPSGDPTEGTNISLRGTTTLKASSNPLILIDGVPGDLNTVPPDEIESIDVLKDGSAAAIYGSRGSNGVILITTKNRTTEQSSRIQYDGYVNMQKIANKPGMLDAAGVRQYEDEYDNLEDLGYNTDWIDVITRTPVSHRHNLSFSAGDQQTNYTASVNYQNTQGLFLNSDNEVVTGRFNVRHSMFEDKLTANLNTIVRSQNYFTGDDDGSSFNELAYRNALTRNPTDRPRDDEGNYVYRPGFEYDNPLVLIEEVNGENVNRELRLNGTLSFDPIEQLNFEVLGSYNQRNQTRGYSETLQHISAVKGNNDAYASRGTGTFEDQLMELSGTYNEDFANHAVTLLGGYSWQQVVEEDYSMQNYNFPTDAYGYNRMQSGDALSEGAAAMNSFKSSYTLIGYFSRLNYNYDDRYLVMGSIRYEGNSKFGADNKWGWFPAVSAGWRLSQENFMDEVNFITDLKLRAGYGVTGIAPENPYLSLPSLNYGDRVYNNGTWTQTVSPARNANPDLRWERKEEINVGIDFAMFSERLSGKVDVYRRTTNDMLWDYDVPVPPNVFPSITANVGTMRNEGIEVGLDYQILQNSNLTWNTSVIGSTNRNKLISLSNELYETTNDFFYAGNTGPPIQLSTHRVDIGGPIGNFYGYKSVDITDEGTFVVLNAAGEEVELDQASLDDRYVLGNGIPDYNLGWSHSVRYKNIDLNVTMRGAFGHQILNFQRMFYENPNLAPENVLASSFDDIYGKRTLDSGLGYVSYYVEDGDYWKIDNITLGYTFGVGTLNYIQNARLYLSGDNLFTFTGYKGMDPEVNTSGLIPGNDPRDKYPTTRTFTFGVNLTF